MDRMLHKVDFYAETLAHTDEQLRAELDIA